MRPEMKAYLEAQGGLIEAVSKAREEMGPEPSVEAGDMLLARFSDPEEGIDGFAIRVDTVTPTDDPAEVTITARVRFSDAFWQEIKGG